ncbi:hypothetical protein JW964_20370, partial [candidate division KSB1 bacterium]|nr:hypothetical protein [candidate division KSB1 bacterium]
QILHWWGDDPNGKVAGFFYTWDSTLTIPANRNAASGWYFTTQNSDTFSLRFNRLDTTFLFRVVAVDDEDFTDPSPARQLFPVFNSPPKVSFIPDSDVPETTFTVASFAWKATDLDGDETIQQYEWTLDDTLETWHPLSPKNNFLTLTADSGLKSGSHAFYLRATDNAGVRSQIIRMPSLPTDKWIVQEPQGKILLLDDYSPVDGGTQFYISVMDSLGLSYTHWDIKADRDRDTRPDLLPPSVLTFKETLRLFKLVVWYGDESPKLEYAQISIPDYVNQGGKVLFSTRFKEFFTEQGDPLDFSPADSLGLNIKRILNGTQIQPLPFQNLPTLKVQTTAGIIPFVKTLIKKPSAIQVYQLESNTQWPGNPDIALESADKSLIFFALPIHLLDGNRNARRMLSLLLSDHLGVK